jgi:hypothetical protein
MGEFICDPEIMSCLAEDSQSCTETNSAKGKSSTETTMPHNEESKKTKHSRDLVMACGIEYDGPPETREEAEAYVWNWLICRGLNDYQCAGIMGNWRYESNLDPCAVEGIKGTDKNYGEMTKGRKELSEKKLKEIYKDNPKILEELDQPDALAGGGIGQWTGNRAADLQNFATTNGKNVRDLDLQLDFAIYEDRYSSFTGLDKNTKEPINVEIGPEIVNLLRLVEILWKKNMIEQPKIKNILHNLKSHKETEKISKGEAISQMLKILGKEEIKNIKNKTLITWKDEDIKSTTIFFLRKFEGLDLDHDSIAQRFIYAKEYYRRFASQKTTKNSVGQESSTQEIVPPTLTDISDQAALEPSKQTNQNIVQPPNISPKIMSSTKKPPPKLTWVEVREILAKEVWKFYKLKGLKDEEIAGIMGNIDCESDFDPVRNEIGGNGFGLFQFMGELKKEFMNVLKDDNNKGFKNNNNDKNNFITGKELINDGFLKKGQVKDEDIFYPGHKYYDLTKINLDNLILLLNANLNFYWDQYKGSKKVFEFQGKLKKHNDPNIFKDKTTEITKNELRHPPLVEHYREEYPEGNTEKKYIWVTSLKEVKHREVIIPTIIFHNYYEISGDGAGGILMRINAAERWYEKIKEWKNE